MTEAADTQINQSVSNDEDKANNFFDNSAENEQPQPDNETQPDQSTDTAEGAGDKSLLGDKDDSDKPEDKPEGEQEKEAIEYDIKLGDDALADEQALDRVKEFAQQHELSNEAAQATLDLADALLADRKEADQATWDAQVVGWNDEIKADPELGGDNYNQTAQQVIGLLDKFAPEGFKQELIDTGFGNHPRLTKLLVNIAKAALPDGPLDTNLGDGPQESKGTYQSMADSMFGGDS